MPITPTKTTKLTWNSDPLVQQIEDERYMKLIEMEQAGKTSMELWQQISSLVVVRHWIDEAAAQEFITFMMGLDQKYGPGLIKSAEILDYQA